MRSGSGDGADKWVLHLVGGGWCATTQECYERSFTALGSSKDLDESLDWRGIFSSDEAVNPDFYNWNIVAFIYCDGGSFAGDR